MQQPLDPFLKLHGKANEKTGTASFKRGIINAVYPQTGTADVQIVGNHSTILKGLFFSSAVNPNAVRIGDKCRVDMFSEINPSDCIIAYIYGRKLSNSAYGFYSASIHFTTGMSTINITVPHNLGSIPTFANVGSTVVSGFNSFSAIFNIGIYVSATGPGGVPFDSNNIYCTMDTGSIPSPGTTRSFGIFWFACSL